MTRFDIHVNLGQFPCSRKGKSPKYVSPKDMYEYFLRQNITHALVLYNRDEYHLLEELISYTDTKVYGVQCIMGTKYSPTDITKPFKFDLGKEGVVGIKIASERGWWTNGKEVWSGINYTDKYITKLLKQLPDNTVVSLHTQGTTNINNTATPMTILNLSKKFRQLKFVMNHGGDYGPALQVAKPSKKRFVNGEGVTNYYRNVSHRMIIESGLICSEFLPNVFIDSSCWTYPKGLVYKNYSQWCVGSDFPFSEGFGIDYRSERKKFEKSSTIPDDKGVYFFNTHIDKINEDFIRDNFTTKD